MAWADLLLALKRSQDLTGSDLHLCSFIQNIRTLKDYKDEFGTKIEKQSTSALPDHRDVTDLVSLIYKLKAVF